MAMGMDMLLQTLIKAVGLKPDVFIPQMQQLFDWNVKTIKTFDARIAATEISVAQVLEHQKLIAEQNAQIIALLKGETLENVSPSINAVQMKELKHDEQ